ncbi:hypothetical protein IIB34_05825, partial [PVC group bacterium]|nr:hypothetical protein [PVC group bacterium]
HNPYGPIEVKSNAIMNADNAQVNTGDYMHGLERNNALRPVGTRHNNGTNVLFCDFHVKWYPTTLLESKPDAWWNYE